MTTKHTPGPWSVETDSYTGGICIIDDQRTMDPIFIDQEDNALENANLIAAAPEMLLELERLCESFGWEGDHPAARVVRKAKGEA